MDLNTGLALFCDDGNPHRELLESFLNLPLTDTEEIFARFAALPRAVKGQGKKPMERYVYIPGTRADRVLLIARADTVWDSRYGAELAEGDGHEVKFAMGIYFTATPKHGIGADDRAGCAMLWGLRESGHSLLLLDGGEHGGIGAKYLRSRDSALFRQINRTHRMMIALDAHGSNSCLFDGVDCSSEFKEYIETNLELRRGKTLEEGDLKILCERICGFHYGMGYVNQHSATEMLFVKGWNAAYQKLYEFLRQEHPVFPISKKARVKRRLKARFGLLFRIRRKLQSHGFQGTAAAVWRRIKPKRGSRKQN